MIGQNTDVNILYGNLEECLTFAGKTGYLTAQEIETVRKSGGSGPGGCSDIDSYTNYCMSHQDDASCKQYAGQAGGFKGPGGCSDATSCTEYCKANQSDPECQKFAGQYGGSEQQQDQQSQGQQPQQPTQ